MAGKENVHRYILERKEGPDGHSWIELKPYDQMKGTYFEVYRDPEDDRWYWLLRQHYSPWPAIARSGQSYSSRSAAAHSIRTAFRTMKDAVRI